MRAAPSNSWSIALKTLRSVAIRCRSSAKAAPRSAPRLMNKRSKRSARRRPMSIANHCRSFSASIEPAMTAPYARIGRSRILYNEARWKRVVEAPPAARRAGSARCSNRRCASRRSGPGRSPPSPGRPIERLYTAEDVDGDRLRPRHRRSRASSRTCAASTRPATAASSGRCGSSPGSARRRRPTSATRT